MNIDAKYEQMLVSLMIDLIS